MVRGNVRSSPGCHQRRTKLSWRKSPQLAGGKKELERNGWKAKGGILVDSRVGFAWEGWRTTNIFSRWGTVWQNMRHTSWSPLLMLARWLGRWIHFLHMLQQFCYKLDPNNILRRSTDASGHQFTTNINVPTLTSTSWWKVSLHIVMKVVLVGNAGVGKTCLVRRFTQVTFSSYFLSLLFCSFKWALLFFITSFLFCLLLYLLLLTNILFIFLEFFFCLLLFVVDILHSGELFSSLFLHISVCLLLTPPEKNMNVTFRACSRLGKERP